MPRNHPALGVNFCHSKAPIQFWIFPSLRSKTYQMLSRNKHPWRAADYKGPSLRVGPSPLSGPRPDLWRSHWGVVCGRSGKQRGILGPHASRWIGDELSKRHIGSLHNMNSCSMYKQSCLGRLLHVAPVAARDFNHSRWMILVHQPEIIPSNSQHQD